jgi:protein-S-isoprenylcysteine O-methyltransferase Ste14
MWAPVICAGIWFGFIVHWVTGSIPRDRIYEIYAGCGIGICLTLLLFGLFGWYPPREDSPLLQALQVAGVALYWASVVLVLLSILALAHRGKPEGFFERTTILIDRGLFGVIRHPLYLGVALWSLGLVLQIQLILPAVLGMVAFSCAWAASKKEDEFNVEKFGEGYKAYMTMVPAWNVPKGLRRTLIRIRGEK